MLTIEIDLASFEREAERFVEGIQRGMLDVAQQTALDGAEHARAVGQFKDHSGELRGSIRVLSSGRIARGGEATFGTTKSYGRFVESGTAPHEIRTRRAGALRWEQGGEIRFARVVYHPGGRAFPFMGPAAIKAEAVLYARAQALVAREIARAG